MKPNIRAILQNCIEEGIAFGVMRAHKYTDKPDIDTISESVEREVWNQIDRYFTFNLEGGQ